jgi:hypothetical protein
MKKIFVLKLKSKKSVKKVLPMIDRLLAAGETIRIQYVG